MTYRLVTEEQLKKSQAPYWSHVGCAVFLGVAASIGAYFVGKNVGWDRGRAQMQSTYVAPEPRRAQSITLRQLEFGSQRHIGARIGYDAGPAELLISDTAAVVTTASPTVLRPTAPQQLEEMIQRR